MSGAPRKVLHVMNGAGGGAALSTLGLVAALRERGVESAVVCHDMGSTSEKDAVRDAVRGAALFVPLTWWNKKIRSAAWKRPIHEVRQAVRTCGGVASTAAVAAFARAQRVDLVHTNTVLTPEGARAAALLGLPHVWHVRELVGPGDPYQFRGGPAGIARRLAAGASLLVANSERTASRLRGLVPDEQLVVVPNGIDLDRFARERPARAANAPVVFGMVANLTTRWKKHALLLEAIAAAKLPSSEVRFYGHGDRSDGYVDALHVRAAQLAVPVSFPGHAADPAAIMRELDVLVHPADHESFGRVVVEAMAAALPVVGVRGGGVGEIVVDGETGLLAPPDDAAALGAAMARAAADPTLRARLGAAGRRRAHDLYSIDACADGVLAAYRRAVTRPVGWRDLLFAKGAA